MLDNSAIGRYVRAWAVATGTQLISIPGVVEVVHQGGETMSVKDARNGKLYVCEADPNALVEDDRIPPHRLDFVMQWRADYKAAVPDWEGF